MLKVLFSVFFSLLPITAQAVTLEFLKKQTFPGNQKFSGQRFGGISQVQAIEGQLFTLTDDRGKYGGPRILIFQMDPKSSTNILQYEKTLKVPLHKDYKIGDLEAFYRFKDGRFLISSEGDFNQKPRVLPFVGIWDGGKKWLDFLTLPQEYLPEKTGLQKKGLRNNLGFEGMTVSRDEKKIWLWSESSLLQSSNGEIEVLEYETKDLKKPVGKFNYTREVPQSGTEIFRGVSDALYVDDDRFLVLERWIEISAKGREIKASLFLYNKNHQTKIKLYNLEGKNAGNWEGMSLQMETVSGNTRILILATDNNFENGTPTQFLFFRYTP